MPVSCRLCGSSKLEPVADFGRIPIAHRPLEKADEVATLYPFALSACEVCGLVQMDEAIDPEELYRSYNFNFSSWKAERHLPAELDTIFAAGPIASAVDIGCNDGLFLEQLRSRGVAAVTGIEANPFTASGAEARGIAVRVGMVEPDLCRAMVKDNGGPFELVTSRQVIEHIPDLDNFFACIGILLAPEGRLFLDMPDFEPSARLGDCSTLWEEHVSYFTEPVLRRLLNRHGYEVRRVDKYDFSGGCLAVLASRRTGAAPPDPAVDPQLAAGFGRKVKSYRARLVQALEAFRGRGAAIVIYGSGVRTCAVANMLDVGGLIDMAVDDQVERQGRYVPGAGVRIGAPGELTDGTGEAVCLLAVNNENEDKVRQKVLAQTRRPIVFASVCGPKDIWAELEALEALASQPATA